MGNKISKYDITNKKTSKDLSSEVIKIIGGNICF